MWIRARNIKKITNKPNSKPKLTERFKGLEYADGSLLVFVKGISNPIKLINRPGVVKTNRIAGFEWYR